MNEISESRWAQAHDELRVALRLPAAEASLRANELVHQALQQTLRTDAEATQTLSDWNIMLDRLEDAAVRRDVDVDEREELDEDRLKADSMGEASLTAMQTDAAQIARMVQVATSSPKVRLHREVAEDLAQLNLRTVDEEHPEGVVAPALGLTRDELIRRYTPAHVVREPVSAVPGTPAAPARSTSSTGRIAPVRASGIDFSREGVAGSTASLTSTPSLRTPASAERSQPVTVSRSTRSGESPQLVLSDEQRSTLVKKTRLYGDMRARVASGDLGDLRDPELRGMHPAQVMDGPWTELTTRLERGGPLELDPITVDLLNDMVEEEGWNLAPDQAGRFGFHVPDHMTDVVDALSAVRAERRREQQGSGSWSKPESRASRTVSLPIAPSETPLAADRGPEY